MTFAGPYFFVTCNLAEAGERGTTFTNLGSSSLAGTLVSSLHRLKDQNDKEGAFFIFGDISVKIEGRFRLQFNLYEMRNYTCHHMLSIRSNIFQVHGPKEWPGMLESSSLTRGFSEQGVRLRLRKEPKSLLRHRGPASDQYVRRQYHRQEVQDESQSSASAGNSSFVSARQSQQSESSSSMYSQFQQLSYDHGSQITDHSYSYPAYQPQQSHQSHSPFNSYAEEPTPKRPRTGTENQQPAIFPQFQTPSESPISEARAVQDFQSNFQYAQPPQPQLQSIQHQQTIYGYHYTQTQAPASDISSRSDNYFSPRIIQPSNTIPSQLSSGPQRNFQPMLFSEAQPTYTLEGQISQPPPSSNYDAVWE